MGGRGRAAVVVLGDIGRCPRMQYHAISLSKQAEMDVDIIAFSGSDPHEAIRKDPRIQLHLMKSPFSAGLPRFLYLLLLPLKLVLQVTILLWILLFRIQAPDLFLVQNPPSIPTLTVVRMACWIRKAAFVIDWHNFGYSILALKLGLNHPLVKIHVWYEKRFGKMADGYLCVTEAMQHELEQKWGIRATVLYDRSPTFFRTKIALQEKHELMSRLHRDMVTPLGNQDCCSEEDSIEVGDISCLAENELKKGGPHQGTYDTSDRPQTLLTTHSAADGSERVIGETFNGGVYAYRAGRPALIVSSTSWTADEDFDILLEAALMYDRRVSAILGENDSDIGPEHGAMIYRDTSSYPRLLIVVTGKGPMKAAFEECVRKQRLRRVAFRTMWVSAEDYPLLLGSSDLGVSLHTSSSGLDLPMKVVDMFGCGLPVCAHSYSCIDELVENGSNGLLFSSNIELADHLLHLFTGFPNASSPLGSLKEGAVKSGSKTRWDDEWREHVLPLIRKVVEKHR